MTNTTSAVASQFSVGDVVDVLNAIRLPKVEQVIHSGRIERITFATAHGAPIYWVAGRLCGVSGHVLRPHQSKPDDSMVRYEITLTVIRPVRYDHDEPMVRHGRSLG